ncbi:uncharacterized protein BCR38DRAFT_370643 [Pseudomassariella vexata]|uniref:HTH APSES-type domain-containing protein n=1 Tax=Pseudomassariella vexata TaxID=1141098 RepID=A0A1Y2DVB0_9PEZI|nr:uncharacterized protein BCR38DRAFT_370643 [Pseudomassariella vexata]ORY63074.1 hypothetical protein BCR38DRAFT_370643 [Pseudomassariella vexata]
MLSVASLLNPAPSGPPLHRYPPSPASSSPTTSFADESAFFDRPMISKHNMAKDAAVFTKGKAKGVVNFYPYERLDEVSLREVRKYQVYPFGKIQEYCRHIPYNSGKKDFFEKTGRESFEVFQYILRVPGDETEYAVMWDYNVGLVRMTPFFKCCKYSKTTPAKMLNMNPGLKEITHSITGGSIMAQGYWMPYQCAKAICATFCHHIAGALIPVFGPDFPSLCTPPNAPEHGRMIIDHSIIIQSTRESELFRRQYSNMLTSAGSLSPKRNRRVFQSPYDDSRHHPRHRIRRTFVSSDSPYATDTDGDISPVTDRSASDRYLYSPAPSSAPPPHVRPSSGWTPANVLPLQYETPGPSTYLSAVPRFTSRSYPQSHTNPPHQSHPHPHTYPPPQLWRSKRPAEHIDPDYEYDAGESRTATGTNTTANSPVDDKPAEPSSMGPDKNAALLLMNLSVQDNVGMGSIKGRDAGAAISSETNSPVDRKFPRIKLLRANSL